MMHFLCTLKKSRHLKKGIFSPLKILEVGSARLERPRRHYHGQKQERNHQHMLKQTKPTIKVSANEVVSLIGAECRYNVVVYATIV